MHTKNVNRRRKRERERERERELSNFCGISNKTLFRVFVSYPDGSVIHYKCYLKENRLSKNDSSLTEVQPSSTQ
jgi:hypothetical protein